MTERYGIPNACGTCHAQQGAAWAARRLAQWFSPWRMESAVQTAAAGADPGILGGAKAEFSGRR